MMNFSCDQHSIDQSRLESSENAMRSGRRRLVKLGAALGAAALFLNPGAAFAQDGSGKLHQVCIGAIGSPGAWYGMCQGLQGGTGPYHQYATRCFQLTNGIMGDQFSFCQNFPQ